MNNQAEVKSLLARLLATENLNVEHKNIGTAYFELASRTLAVPIWKEMTGDLYDLLVGHEISHALETPIDGWHSATCARGKNYKNFLNVIEDARIEKKVKVRYPGLRRAFLSGYAELLKRDFFGIAGQTVSDFPLIDRLNLYAKCGALVPVKFSDAEQVYVKEMESLMTWQDVVRLVNKLWAKAIEDHEGAVKTFTDYSTREEDDLGEDNPDDSEDQQGVEEGDDGETAGAHDHEPRALTEEAFRRNEHTLNAVDAKTFVYANIPTPILENVVIPAKAVNAQLREFYREQIGPSVGASGAEKYRDFLSKNERYIALLVKEFEMRKAAKSFSKSRLSDTGDLNVSKLARHRIEDLIFKKILRTSKGRSHGLVLLLDKSGSMSQNLKAAIEQLLILTMFCRKVKIPFVVYSFGNHTLGHRKDNAFMKYPSSKELREELSKKVPDHIEPCFAYKTGDVDLGSIYLREMCNSSMPMSEFSDMVKNHLMLSEGFSERTRNRHEYGVDVPYTEELNSTPLSEALVAVQPLIARLKQTHRLDIVNLIILHDGDDDTRGILSIKGTVEPFRIGDHHYFCGILRDPRCQFQSSPNQGSTIAAALMEWLRFTTGTHIIGFFMNATKRSVTYTYQTKTGQTFHNLPKITQTEILSSLSKKKFVVSYRTGFDAFYIIPGSRALEVAQEELVVVGKVTASKLATAFRRLGQKKLVNRVLVRQFIEQIAV